MQAYPSGNVPGSALPPAAHWRYRIEGSQKAVFSLAYLPSQSRREPPEPPPQALCVYTALRDRHARHQNPYCALEQVLFRRHLSHFLLQSSPVTLPLSYLLELAAAARPWRPPSRCSQSSISAASGRAELLPDIALHFGSKTILVEVKPKSGVLSRSALVHPEITATLGKFEVPTYHLKNYILPDMHQCPPSRIPDPAKQYNPVELLSGTNIRQQLFNLHAEMSRSLRVFYEGQLLTHSVADHSCNNGVCHTALEVAAEALNGIELGSRKGCLYGLREIQNKDYIDNIGAAVLLDCLISAVGKANAHEMIASYLYPEDDEGDSEYRSLAFLAAKKMLSYETSSEAVQLHCEEIYERAMKSTRCLQPRFIAMMLADFLQAAAAKDCSIMVAICRREDTIAFSTKLKMEDEHEVITWQGEEWLYTVHVVDTRQKSIDKIVQKWAAVDLRRYKRLCASGGMLNLH